MKKMMAGVLATLSTTTVLGVAAPAANAASYNCPAYPPGQHYSIAAHSRSATIRKGGSVTLAAHASRGRKACKGYRVVLYYRPNNVRSYHTAGVGRTGSTGDVAVRMNHVQRGFTFYWSWDYRGHDCVTSSDGTVRVR